MKCNECGAEVKVKSKGVILDHFGRPVKTGDVVLFMLTLSHNLITVEGAEIRLRNPYTTVTPIAMIVQETEHCPLSDDGEWVMAVQGIHCDVHAHATPASHTITGQNYKPHPDIYQLSAQIHEVF